MFLEARGGVYAQPLPCPGQVQHLFLGSVEYIVLCIYISQAEAQWPPMGTLVSVRPKAKAKREDNKA